MSDDADKTRILPDSPAGELPVGAQLSQGMYRITGRIAAGGFGITYEARDNLGRKVAIKECFPAGLALRAGDFNVSAASASTSEPFETARTLFLREARTLATLRHPNIVHVQTMFEENGTAYMAMDYIDGRDLQHVIAHEPALLTPDYIMGLARALLAALEYLHRDAPANAFGQGKEPLLHRDIKPANIRIDPLDAPVIIDFGAARQDTKAQSRAAGTFRVVSDGYSPNEFYVAGTKQGPASDLYALAATLYHCISGSAPVPADERAQKVSNGEADPYVPLAGRFPAHDPHLLALLDRALARPLNARPPDAAAWLAALPDPTTRILTPAPAPPAPTSGARAPTGFWKAVAGASLAALALGGIGIYALSSPPVTEADLRQQLSQAQAQVTEMETERDLLLSTREGAYEDRDAAANEVERLTREIRDRETQIADLAAQAPDGATLITLEAERSTALAAQQEAERDTARALSDLQRMGNDLAESEAEVARLNAALRTLGQEMDLLRAGTTQPNIGPDIDRAPACPDARASGEERRLTGPEIYIPRTLDARAGGTTNLSTCDGMPFNASGVVDAAPDYTLRLSEMDQFSRIEMEITAACDATLLVNTNDGAWHFGARVEGTSARVNLSGADAITGRISVWVGTSDGSECPASVTLSSWIN